MIPLLKGCPAVGLIPRKWKRNHHAPPCLGEALKRVIFVNTMIFLEIRLLLNFSIIWICRNPRWVIKF